MLELHELTIDWAREKGILDNSKVTTQALKLGAEFGELCGNLPNNRPIEDDIGDCLIVCAIIANLQGKDLIRILNSSPEIHTTPLVSTATMYLGEIQDMVINNRPIDYCMRNFIKQLEGIASLRHTTLKDGWKAAYLKEKDGATTPSDTRS